MGKKFYDVFHAKRDRATFMGHNHPNFPEDYDQVATVMSETLGDVFRITNHIDHAWYDNVEVVVANREARSTSVGDVVLEVEGGAYYRVEMVGWKKIGFKHPLNNDRVVLID
jgi:hypothetical protein